jgi:putative nucleotidyltransferase with HDIG domain
MITREQAFELLREHRVPKNITDHCIAVNRVAMFLVRKFKEAGIEVDGELVDIASLLHDIDKMETRDDHTGHGERSYEILKGISPEVAKVVRKHNLGNIAKGDLKTWEEKIVNYADKRVSNDNIVSLKERFEYLRKRYGSISKEAMEFINRTEPLAHKLEEEIFSRIKAKPEDILTL